MIFGPKIDFLCKNAFLCPHVADAYKTNGILTKMEVILAQSRFFEPKVRFGPQNRLLEPKIGK